MNGAPVTRFFFTTARDSLPGIVCAACPDHGSVGALVILAGDGSGEEAVPERGGGGVGAAQ